MLFRLCALTCATFVLAVAPAAAQPNHAARLHYESGQRLFDAGSYELAIEEFREALRLSGKPALWFNIGQAYRLSGNCERALEAYETYASLDARAGERTNVVARIEEMRACTTERADAARRERERAAAAAAEAAVDADEDGGAAVDEAAAPTRTRTDDVDDGTARRWIGGALVVGGVTAAGASVYLRQRAASDADDLTRRYAQGGAWDADADAAESRIAGDRRKAIALASAGGIALAAGLYLYVTGREQAEYAQQFALAPTRGGAEMVWSWQF